MSETTELVRRIVREVLKNESNVNSSLARSISSKIAGDPHLDRVEISDDTIEPVAHTVADATYRIDLEDFGVTNPDQVRREIVEKTVESFEVQTTGSEGNIESGSEDSKADEDEIIVAGSSSSESETQPEASTDDSSGASESLSNQSTASESKIAGSVDDTDDDIIVAEPDNMDAMGTAYDDEESVISNNESNDNDSSDKPVITW